MSELGSRREEEEEIEIAGGRRDIVRCLREVWMLAVTLIYGAAECGGD